MGAFAVHHPLVFAFGILGNLVAFMVYLAPLPTFYGIFKKKSTEGFQSVPYVVSLLSSILWIYYGITKSNIILLITINSFGCLIEAIYIAIFITYAPKKAKIITLKLLVLLNLVGFGCVVILTQFLVKGSERVQVIGWVAVALSASVYIAPLSVMKQVVRTKSVEFLPITLTLALLLNAVMWFSYGLLLRDFYITVPNVLGFIFGVLQVILYVIYKNYTPKGQEETLPTTVKSIATATSEIHPVSSDESDPAVDITIREEIEVSKFDHEEIRVHVIPNNHLILSY
ncbi:bidirectional sugar transporter SWEET14-like [Primulina huaijiensis]|uniref:bidirectional sugar transporter SWEET14-like n=1 Tax=Primulina huaijiensis TaxID=1492673 RepID=UPI003CC75E57